MILLYKKKVISENVVSEMVEGLTLTRRGSWPPPPPNLGTPPSVPSKEKNAKLKGKL